MEMPRALSVAKARRPSTAAEGGRLYGASEASAAYEAAGLALIFSS
jgi:hypothetical protein